jgi:long-chain acyl-CoA synthetase
MFEGYYKDPEGYEQAVSRGWLCTGDHGSINDDGHLLIFDRMKDVITLSTGIRCAPQYMESRLRVSPYIAEAVVVGDNRPYPAAVVLIDYNTVGRWAEEQHLTYTTYADLSQKTEVYYLILQEVRQVNKGTADALWIKKLLLLPKQLDADDAELTRLRKLRRHYVQERYAAEIEALYGDKPEILSESVVVYQDGHSRSTSIAVKIMDV